jgi:putative ABC transport system permease protein
MFKSYFKTAWRNLLRNKGFSFTNLLGLTIGITCTILISLWVNDELNYNKFHKNYENIYQVVAHRDFQNQVFTDFNMVFPLADALQKSSPQVINATMTTNRNPHIVTYGDLKLKKFGYSVNERFFDVFTFKFLKGVRKNAISDPHSIVFTRSAAASIFGDKDPIGQVIKMDNYENYTVSAIVEDVPGNSSLQFEFVTPFNYSDPNVKQLMGEWRNSSWNVYLHMTPGADMKVMDKKINEIKKSHDKNDAVSTYFSFPMKKWRLYSDFKDGKNVGGMIEYVRMFTIIAIVILLIACVNFMNLSTARSERRAREVGIRKTLGSNKRQLVMQFFSESIILTLIAFFLSLAAVYLLLPAFNSLVDKQLTIGIATPIFWLLALGIILFTGIVAGSYPALYLSSFNPVKVLKGTLMAGRDAILPRRILVIGQFVISIVLISATVIIYQQIQYIKNRDMGYNPDNLLMVTSSGDVDKNYSVIKQELLKSGFVNSVSKSSSPITAVWWKSPGPDFEGKRADATVIFSALATDVGFSKTFGIKMIQGNDFSGQPVDSATMLLNKAAVAALGIKNPVGMRMRYGKDYTVIGVIDDVIMESPFKPVDPLMVYFDKNYSAMVNIRLNENAQVKKAMAAIEDIFKKYNPSFPFDYQFVDEEFSKKFITEKLISRITNIFAGLAIFICCIGLAGLASFTIEKRTREIGIRKVLGASLRQLLGLISKEFLKLVMIAFVIAVPLTWWLMSNWLENYEYRVQISLWLFFAVGFMVLILALVVVSANTLKAAMNNPVRSLRTE